MGNIQRVGERDLARPGWFKGGPTSADLPWSVEVLRGAAAAAAAAKSCGGGKEMVGRVVGWYWPRVYVVLVYALQPISLAPTQQPVPSERFPRPQSAPKLRGRVPTDEWPAVAGKIMLARSAGVSCTALVGWGNHHPSGTRPSSSRCTPEHTLNTTAGGDNRTVIFFLLGGRALPVARAHVPPFRFVRPRNRSSATFYEEFQPT